jgi:predicted RNA-binding Zn-ribbon protein involved in translation (DUF1610 family)
MYLNSRGDSVTDHLEPYRRMARSIRFFPPSALALKPIPQPVTADAVADSWVKTSSNADVKSIEPPIDLSERAAALVHEAVWKPTVLPATYVIPENIGDRISRLVASSSVDLAKIKPNLPQPACNGTTAHGSATFETSSDRLVYDPQRQVYALESTIVAEALVAEPIAVVAEAPETIVAEPIAVVAEAPETIVAEPIAVVAEAPETIVAEPIVVAETDTPIAEVESNQPPTLLEKVSSVIEAVSTAFMNPELVQKENEAVEEAASSTSEAIATPVKDTEELLTTEPTEPSPAPSLLERVSAVVEVVTTTLKNPEAIASTPTAPQTAPETKPIAVACPACSSTELRKNGRRQGKQRYACKDCGRQFAMADTVTVEAQSKAEEVATVETTTITDSQADTDLSDTAAKSAGKKKKAKGFGASKKSK